jgi:hypothetical protein
VPVDRLNDEQALADERFVFHRSDNFADDAAENHFVSPIFVALGSFFSGGG